MFICSDGAGIIQCTSIRTQNEKKRVTGGLETSNLMQSYSVIQKIAPIVPFWT